jgi:hypothetical protein
MTGVVETMFDAMRTNTLGELHRRATSTRPTNNRAAPAPRKADGTDAKSTASDSELRSAWVRQFGAYTQCPYHFTGGAGGLMMPMRKENF